MGDSSTDTVRTTTLEMTAPPRVHPSLLTKSKLAIMCVPEIPLPFYRYLYGEIGKSHYRQFGFDLQRWENPRWLGHFKGCGSDGVWRTVNHSLNHPWKLLDNCHRGRPIRSMTRHIRPLTRDRANTARERARRPSPRNRSL